MWLVWLLNFPTMMTLSLKRSKFNHRS